MKRVLPVIVLSQFFCTSLWFAGNAVMGDIAQQFHIQSSYLAHLTSVVQFGFITGTLLFAIFSISDRFSPSRVFFASAVAAAIANMCIVLSGISLSQLMALRFITGFFLAGIYPVGMKIAADYYEKGLGRSLGFLVGALVLGTAFPHLLKGAALTLPWRYVIFATSALSLAGGLSILLLVPDGPYRRQGTRFSLSGFLQGFRQPAFRAAAIGYFGHMWELYSFWVFVPVMLAAYNAHYPHAAFNVPVLSFCIIATGSVACVCSGLLSQYIGVKRTATAALVLSGICCLLSPLLLLHPSATAFLIFLFIWSIVVIADSPLFSTLVAGNAPAASRGASLTIVNCIGFSITILSIQLMSMLRTDANTGYIYVLLAAGPLIGIVALLQKSNTVR